MEKHEIVHWSSSQSVSLSNSSVKNEVRPLSVMNARCSKLEDSEQNSRVNKA